MTHDLVASRAGGSSRGRLWQAVAIAAAVVLLAVLRMRHPWTFLANDKRNQYLPVLQDIGRRLREGDFPVVDPDLGPGGNYALDVQYGLYDPLHLAIGYGLSFMSDPYLAGWLMSVPFVVILAWGTTALLQRLGCPGVWSAAAGLGAATSGYLLSQLATYWWPGLIGAAFLPWVWWAWAGEVRARRLVAVAAFSYLVVASGWPSAWLAYAMLSAGLLVEAAWRLGRPRWASWWPFVARVLAAGAGVLVGAVHVMALLHASEWTRREQGIENTYYQIPNWADVLSFAVPYLHGEIPAHEGAPTVEAPLFFFGWFLLGLAWVTTWDRAVWSRRGVVTAAVATAAALLATQLPSDLGPIRVPSRQLAAVQFFSLVFLVLAWRASPAALTGRRVAGVLATYAAMAVVAWSRTPTDVEVAVGIVAGLVALGVLTALWWRWGTTVAGAWALVGTLLLTVLSVGLEHQDETPRVTERVLHRATEVSVSEEEQPAAALFGDPFRADWLEQGVGIGFSALTEENRHAPGYSSVSQRHYGHRFGVVTPSGKTTENAVRALFEREPSTGLPWVDLLGYRVVLVHRSRADLVEKASEGEWAPVARSEHFVKLARTDESAGSPVAGRVTATVGEVSVEAVSVGGESQRYDVSAPDGGRLVFRDVYWPGYVATLDGEPLPVTPLQQLLVSVVLPPGAEGELVVEFRAPSARSVAATVGGGGFLLLLALGVYAREVRSRQRPPRSRPTPAR